MAPRAFAFASLLSGSDLIVTGKVQDVITEPTVYHISFLVEDYIKGTSNDRLIKIDVPLANGLRLEDEPYLEKDGRSLLLFLKPGLSQGVRTITNHAAGVLPVGMKDDVTRLVQAYQSNPNFFAKENSAAAQNLFFAFTQQASKQMLLNDLESILSPQDEPFLSALLDSGTEAFQVFGALQAGRLKIASLREKVETLLKSSMSFNVKFHCVVGLGDLGNANSLPLVLEYVQDSNADLRNVAFEAAGKIGGNEIVQPLRERYPQENSDRRLTIIEAIYRLSDRAMAKNTLSYFRSIESKPLLQSILDNRLSTF